MRASTVAIAFTASVGLAVAQPHGHAHRHIHHRHASVPTAGSSVVTVFEFNGQLISAEEAAEGVRNGTLVYGSAGAASAPVPANELKTKVPGPHILAAEQKQKPKPEWKAPVALRPAAGSKSGSDSLSNEDAIGINADFPDGLISCSTFPSQYGAIAVEWAGLGGWTDIQSPSGGESGFSDIRTVTKSMCLDGNCCTEGSYCSYACPPGYQKSQWPRAQGSTGQSIGGILCKGNKLHLTNPSLSKSLCMGGTNKVKVQIKNNMGQSAAVCRTDYPGTESETVPLDAKPGSTSPLTCPDADNYYQWTRASTSAQYYANPAGVPVSVACQWGSPENPWGNFAPINLGVGYSNGAAWLSIFQNLPTTSKKLDYSIEIVGDNGGFDNLIGRCKYNNGKYCSGDDYSNCNPDKGCTVRIGSGTATYVFS